MQYTHLRVKRGTRNRLFWIAGKDYSIDDVLRMLLDDFTEKVDFKVGEKMDIDLSQVACPDCGGNLIENEDTGCIECEECDFEDCIDTDTEE